MNHLARIAISSILILWWTSFAFARTEIMNLRYWTAPDHTRIVLDIDEDAQYTVEKSEQQIVLRIENAALLKTMPREFILNQRVIKKVLLTPLPSNSVQIEFFLETSLNTHIFKLKRFQDKPYRLVVDILFPEVEKETSQAREKVKASKKDKIILIDPGHGGDDPGARGRRGTNEKDIVLEISKKLKDILDAGTGTRAFLTREGDYYVPFKKRLSIAREIGADLFISIHADAARNRMAKGSSVYCLSTGGASSVAAKILAGKENRADMIGGERADGMNGDASDPVILDMFQNNTINKSKTFGATILGSLCKINDIKFPRVQEAPFRVLKLPEIPAVLIETAYISNLNEERYLRDKKHQAKIAHAIAGAVREYFALPLMVASPLTPGKSKINDRGKDRETEMRKTVQSVYRVEKGDTLHKIASMHDTKVGALVKLNQIKMQDVLYAGQVLKIYDTKTGRKKVQEGREANNKTIKGGPAPLIHKVKKGDTLGKIAKRYETTIAALLKLNHLKLHDSLYVDRALKIPTS